jgi:LPXTG-motif cell wall-anchored protein
MRTRIQLAVLVALFVLAVAPSAGAQPSGGHVDKPDNGEVLSQTVEPSTSTEGAQTAAPNQLPFTGADVTLFLVVGLAAIGTGTFLLRRTRVERAES